MKEFLALPGPVQSAVMVGYYLILCAEIYCLIACALYKIRKFGVALTVLLFLFTAVNIIVLTQELYILYYGGSTVSVPQKLDKLPGEVLFLLIAFQIVAVCFNIYRVKIWQKNNITALSVKQGTDRLTTGICCYDENGRPHLVNHSMERLCRTITGEPLLNANEFWKRLTDGEVLPGNTVIKSGREPIILLENGEVRSFSRNQILSESKVVFELSAADITEQYQLSSQLMESNAQLEEVKNRLVLFSENVADITREKEILAAKMSIHDRLGNALLAARRYIETGEEAVSRKTLLEIWQNNIALLQREAQQPENSHTLDSLYEAAQIMGITLCVEGVFPKDDNRAMRLIMSAARECITNATHHANATVLKICIFSDKDYNIIAFSNNGKPPKDGVREGGGLSALRKSVENEGGEMEIDCTPQFVLRLKTPKLWGLRPEK